MGLDERPDERTDDRSEHTGEDDVGDGELLLVRVVQIGDHTQRDTAPSRRQTAKSSSDNYRAKVRRKRRQDLPDYGPSGS